MNFLKKLKELLIKNKDLETNKEILYNLGDIILAEYKYECSNEKNGQIRIAPFIVLEDRGIDLLCVKGSKNIKNNVSKPKILDVKSNKYNLNQDTYFYLSRVRKINKSNVINQLDYLNDKDKYNLLSKLNILINRNYTFSYFPNLPEYKAKVGDVISCSTGNYLIVDEKENNYFCLGLYNTTKICGNNCIDLDGHYYYVNFDVIVMLNKNDNKRNIIGDINKEELLNVLNSFIEYQDYLENKKNYSVKKKMLVKN